MRLLLILALVSGSFNVLAQGAAEPVLFPELVSWDATHSADVEKGIPKKSEELKTEKKENQQEEDLFKEKTPVLEPVVASPKGIQEVEDIESEDEKKQDIYIMIDDVSATLTPNRETSFCSASFKVTNNLKKEIKAFSGSFTIGSMQKEFRFANIQPDQSVTDDYVFVGKSCETILDPPAYVIQVCQVEGWSEKKCKNKVKLIPIVKEENTL